MKVTIEGVTYRIWFEHRPEWQHEHGQGATFARIAPEAEGGGVLFSIATCSKRDIYSRARGRKVALAKLLKLFGFTQPQRTQVWKQLFEKGMRP